MYPVRLRAPVLLAAALLLAYPPHAWPCTSIMVGKAASTDDSVMTSHTCDSHRTSSAVVVVPARDHKPGSSRLLTKRTDDDSGPMPRYGRQATGKIPQVAHSFAYIAPAYAVMNERQLAIGESTFEGTDYDMVKDLTVTDEKGMTVKSPLANSFMPYEMNHMLRINGGWGWRGERPIARWYCMYATVTQSRSWLPDAVGGVVWFGYGNPAMTAYVPLYAGIADLPEDYKTDGRTTGFSRRSAWWAFNRVETLAAHRWGDMRKDVAAVRDPIEEQFLTVEKDIATEAAALIKEKGPNAARAFLTQKSRDACALATEAYWNLGDLLWTKYDEKW